MVIRRIALGSLVVIASLAARAADPAIEFSGVLTADGKTRVALTDKAADSTRWLEAGDEFNGYTIARYDAEEDAVVVAKGGSEFRLPLAKARTVEVAKTASEPPLPAAPTATATAIRGNLRMLATAARQYQQTHGANAVSFADLVGPGKPISEIRPIAGENYSTLSFAPNVTGVSVTTASGETVALELSNPANAARPMVSLVPRPEAAAVAPAATAAPVAAAPDAASAATLALEPTGRAAAAITDSPRQPASPSTMIQGGDTWQTISARTGVPEQQLRQLNPAILEGSSLPAGQTIRIR